MHDSQQNWQGVGTASFAEAHKNREEPSHHGLGRLANADRLFTRGDDRMGLGQPSTVDYCRP
jgi:hypothetical protein